MARNALSETHTFLQVQVGWRIITKPKHAQLVLSACSTVLQCWNEIHSGMGQHSVAYSLYFVLSVWVKRVKLQVLLKMTKFLALVVGILNVGKGQ